MTVLVTTSYGRNTLRRLRREARILDLTGTPRLAPAYEVDPFSSESPLLTEYVPDITLDDLVAIAPLPAAAALHALRDVAVTLHAMHDCGLVHGALTPSAVLIMPDGRAALARPDAAPPASGTSVDEARRRDAHGFAVLAFELLAGVHPLEPRNTVAMTSAQPMLPPAAAVTLRRALSGSRARRPAPLELLDLLDAVPVEAWPTNGLRHLPLPDPAPGLPVPPAEPPSRWEPPAQGVAVDPVVPDASEPVEPVEPVEMVEPVAEPGAAPPSPAQPVAVRVVRPQPRRPRWRRVLSWFVLLLGLATVFAGGWSGATMLFTPATADGTAVLPLEVKRVAMSATPPLAQCPRATMHFAATIVTDGGGGELEVRWRMPDGSLAGTETFRVQDGRTTLRSSIDLTFEGRRQLVGDITAIIQPLGVRATVPLRYLCPGPTKKRPESSRAV